MIRRTLHASLLFALPFAALAACGGERLDGGTDAPDAATTNSDGGIDGLDEATDKESPSKDGGGASQPSEGPVTGTIVGKPFVLASAELEKSPSGSWLLTLSNFDGQCHSRTRPMGPDTLFVNVGPIVLGPSQTIHMLDKVEGQPNLVVSATFQVGLYMADEQDPTLVKEIGGTVELGAASGEPGSSVSGALELASADGESHVSGTFTATICSSQ